MTTFQARKSYLHFQYFLFMKMFVQLYYLCVEHLCYILVLCVRGFYKLCFSVYLEY